MAIRKFGALIDLDQLQLTPGCHQEEEQVDILIHARRGQKHLVCKLSCRCEERQMVVICLTAPLFLFFPHAFLLETLFSGVAAVLMMEKHIFLISSRLQFLRSNSHHSNALDKKAFLPFWCYK